jgi:hypothetical protein
MLIKLTESAEELFERKRDRDWQLLDYPEPYRVSHPKRTRCLLL